MKGGRVSDQDEDKTAAIEWSPENDPDGVTREELEAQDWLLESLFDFMFGYMDERTESSFGATFVVGGQQVSGTVISRRAWIKEQEAALQDRGDAAESLGKYMRAVWDSVTQRLDEKDKNRQAQDLPNPSRSFFHMKDARIGTGKAATSVPFWRGHMDEITGWSLVAPGRASMVE